jgi:hypothetical protein
MRRSEKWNEFFYDVSLAFQKRTNGLVKAPPCNITNTCQYHEHVAMGKPCWRQLLAWPTASGQR